VEYCAPEVPEGLFPARWERGAAFTPARERELVRAENLLEEFSINADFADEPIDLGAQRVRRFFLKKVGDG
jgi:hypothetical protein